MWSRQTRGWSAYADHDGIESEAYRPLSPPTTKSGHDNGAIGPSRLYPSKAGPIGISLIPGRRFR